MDEKVTAVLEIYHDQIRQERLRGEQIMTELARLRALPETEQTRAQLARLTAGSDTDGIDRRLYAVGPSTGQLMNLLARTLASPTILEIGTSYGYSGIWLAEAARASGGRLITMELHDYKSASAREMIDKAGLADVVDFRVGDAVQLIRKLETRVDFVLLDLWKDLYVPCLEAFYPKLNPGAIVVADNMLRPGGQEVALYGEAVRAMPKMRSVLLPIGSGLEISRFEPLSPY